MATPEWQSYFALEARLLVGLVFLLAGAAKLADAQGTSQAIRNYVPVSDALLPSLGRALPLIEVALGACLALGFLGKPIAIAAIGLLGIFSAGGVLNLLRGRKMDCHCFGGVLHEPLGWSVIARNGVLAGLILAAISTRADLFSLDGLVVYGPSVAKGWPPLLDLLPAVFLVVLVMLAYLLTMRALGLEAGSVSSSTDLEKGPVGRAEL